MEILKKPMINSPPNLALILISLTIVFNCKKYARYASLNQKLQLELPYYINFNVVQQRKEKGESACCGLKKKGYN